MKIAIDMGHTLRGSDTGAEGCGRKEQDLTREVGNLVISKLQELGHEVVNCTIDSCSSLNESLSYRVNVANNSNADLFCCIHFNCGGGYGTEVFTYNGQELSQARNILNNICALGFTNRGIKSESLYVINHTNMPSMLVECCFIDSQEDMSKYNANNFANAIVKGLVGQTIDTNITRNEYKEDENTMISFSEDFYINTYSDVAQAIKNGDFKNGYEHYIQYGKAEGRKPLPDIPNDFSVCGYIYCNPDLEQACKNGLNPINHYLTCGWRENRKWSLPQIPQVNEIADEDNSNKEVFYRVVTGSYKERDNAEEQIKKLKDSGFDSFLDVYKK